MTAKKAPAEIRSAIGDFYIVVRDEGENRGTVEVFTYSGELAGGIHIATFYPESVGIEQARAYAENFATVHSSDILELLEQIRILASGITIRMKKSSEATRR